MGDDIAAVSRETADAIGASIQIIQPGASPTAVHRAIAETEEACVRLTRLLGRLRSFLPGNGAGDFARHATEEDKRQLCAVQDQLDQCVTDRAPDKFGRLSLEWHRIIVQGAGNSVISELLKRLNVPIHRLLFESFYDEGRLRTANADHRKMLQLILAGDAEGAEAAMRGHIADGFDTLSKIESEFYC